VAPGKRLADTASELNSAAIHLLRALRATDRAAGLTPARLSALSVLVFGGPSPLGRLARTEDVAGPTMTRIVDGLVARGLAERQPTGDRRAVRVVATRAGHEVMDRGRRRRVEVLTEALAALPAADRRRLRAVGPLLDRLAAEVRARA
jgi:DNA-binding MarR family transcriptional regulator